MLKIEEAVIERSLQVLSNKYLYEGRIVEAWQNTEAVLLFKIGDNSNIENYRTICLFLSVQIPYQDYYEQTNQQRV